ncbi:hypothetical protein FACS1894216_02180 [Synergistales bacterium]|nr:hypothetical protein FACS1894216_02180 [Synergistales bacterium]
MYFPEVKTWKRNTHDCVYIGTKQNGIIGSVSADGVIDVYTENFSQAIHEGGE